MGLRSGRLIVATFIVMCTVWLGSPRAQAANLDEACGGAAEESCNSALWCHKEAGKCGVADAAGICEKAPGFCMRVSRPVCGCNGKTYPNECEARHAKVQVDYATACKKSADSAAPPAPVKKKKKSLKSSK